jgi:hypothetical protein
MRGSIAQHTKNRNLNPLSYILSPLPQSGADVLAQVKYRQSTLVLQLKTWFAVLYS